MKPNFNNCSYIKGLRFLLKKSLLTTVVFYTQKKTQRGKVRKETPSSQKTPLRFRAQAPYQHPTW